MKKFEEVLLGKLQGIQEMIDSTLYQKTDFTVKTISSEGVSYTHDRERFLQTGLEAASNELQLIVEEITDRLEKKEKIQLIK